MTKNTGWQGCLLEIVVTMLTTLVMLVISTGYRHYGDETFCSGGLGAGFPVSFLCDYAEGGSPISSWGKIDLADFPYFTTPGLIVDTLFYALILWMAWLIRRLFVHAHSNGAGNTVWIAMIVLGFLFGFLSAAALYKADRINFHNYILGIPSSVPATATPVGTPPPALTQIPTPGP